ncbi:hypothetical protein GCM10010301_72470 [Streptomyces plicatus]|nr:hypothetical protein GCM10010301_72470 [Streptomyces plicatus]
MGEPFGVCSGSGAGAPREPTVTAAGFCAGSVCVFSADTDLSSGATPGRAADGSVGGRRDPFDSEEARRFLDARRRQASRGRLRRRDAVAGPGAVAQRCSAEAGRCGTVRMSPCLWWKWLRELGRYALLMVVRSGRPAGSGSQYTVGTPVGDDRGSCAAR